MIHSFRLRLALLSALLAGLALVAFGAGSWWLIRNIRLDNIDGEVRTYAEREVGRARQAGDWPRAEVRLRSAMGVRESRDLLLLVEDTEGGELYRSPHWPGLLDPAALPWPAWRGDPRRSGFGPPPAALADDAPPPGPGMEGPPPQRRGLRPDFPPPGPPPLASSVTRKADGQSWHIGLAANGRARVAVAINAAVIDDDMNGIRNAYLIALPLVLLLVGLGGWVFSGRAMRPLNKLAAATREVTAEGLNRRIPEQGEDQEFVELIRVYNRMLERLDRSFRQARRFSADAAHELRTPLAILQGQLERAIQELDDGSAMQQKLTGILDEVRRLSTISRKLLLLSQADAGGLKLHREAFSLSRVLDDLVEDTRMLAPGLKVTSHIQPGIEIIADGSLLQQVLHNLVSNAIKYNVDQGWIEIAAAARPSRVEVTVANASQGIPEAARDRIFERFYRADPSHSRQVEGVGLGLSVSREIARAHGGDIVVNVDNQNAVRFVVSLPFNSQETPS